MKQHLKAMGRTTGEITGEKTGRTTGEITGEKTGRTTGEKQVGQEVVIIGRTTTVDNNC